jgi:tripartite-type tricarboxylate transporter receptor subunit TctC
MSRTIVAIWFALALAFSGAAAAQEWPTRPVTLVVPFAAGSAADVFVRIMAPRMSEVLGQRVLIENIGGGGGTIGSARVARAAPDGYLFVMGGNGTHVFSQIVYRKPPYNAVTDFEPVVLVAEQPLVLVARKDFPAGNFREFMAYAKANPVSYGSGGPGSVTHLGCVLINAAMGTNLMHVPYRGTGPAMQDLRAGRIDFLCDFVLAVLPQIESGAIRAIATLTKTRSPVLPNLETAQEQGLSDFEAYVWQALFLPKGTPEAIVKRLHDATAAAMDTPAIRNRVLKLGIPAPAPRERNREVGGRDKGGRGADESGIDAIAGGLGPGGSFRLAEIGGIHFRLDSESAVGFVHWHVSDKFQVGDVHASFKGSQHGGNDRRPGNGGATAGARGGCGIFHTGRATGLGR